MTRTLHALLLAGAIGAASGCIVVDTLDGLDAPADLSCGDAAPVVVDGAVYGDATVTGARADANGVHVDVAAVDRDDHVSIDFPVDADAAPAVPELGPAQWRADQADCFGEGCDDSYWTLSSADDALFFSVGTLNQIDDGGVRPSLAGVSLRAGRDGEVCGDDGSALAAVAVFVDDDGAHDVAVGEGVDLVIDGAPFRARTWHATRSSFTQTDRDCADCAEPGTHTTLAVSTILYRKQL